MNNTNTYFQRNRERLLKQAKHYYRQKGGKKTIKNLLLQ